MYRISVLYEFVILSACLAAIPPSNSLLQLPPNTSLLATGPANHMLADWPKLPWRWRLKKDLYMDFGNGAYGAYAEPVLWPAIAIGIDNIVHQIESEQGGPDTWVERQLYLDHLVFLWLQGQRLRRSEAVKFLFATKGLFFLENYQPRGFAANIRQIRESREVHVDLFWRDPRPYYNWPETETLPARFSANYLNHQYDSADLDIDIISYGRNVHHPDSGTVARALNWFIKDIMHEGPQQELINVIMISREAIYLEEVVALRVLRPEDGSADRAQVTRAQMIRVVMAIRSLYFAPKQFGPREFVANLIDIEPYTYNVRQLGVLNITWLGNWDARSIHWLN